MREEAKISVAFTLNVCTTVPHPRFPRAFLMPDPLHPHYDEVGVVYDGGFFYADGLPDNPPVATPRRNKPMASLSLNLSRKNPVQLIALTDLVAPKIAPAAPAVSPLPV